MEEYKEWHFLEKQLSSLVAPCQSVCTNLTVKSEIEFIYSKFFVVVMTQVMQW